MLSSVSWCYFIEIIPNPNTHLYFIYYNFFSFQSVIENSKFFEQYEVTYQILKRAAEMYAKANGSGKYLYFFHHWNKQHFNLFRHKYPLKRSPNICFFHAAKLFLTSSCSLPETTASGSNFTYSLACRHLVQSSLPSCRLWISRGGWSYSDFLLGKAHHPCYLLDYVSVVNLG